MTGRIKWIGTTASKPPRSRTASTVETVPGPQAEITLKGSTPTPEDSARIGRKASFESGMPLLDAESWPTPRGNPWHWPTVGRDT